jgi:hypothetical protein
MPTVVAIGNSHIDAIRNAAEQLDVTALPFRLRCLRLMPAYTPYWLQEDGGMSLNPEFSKDAEALLHSERPDLVLCFASSNGHFNLGLFTGPKPFDFIHPEKPDLPLLPHAQIVPYDLMREKSVADSPWWSQIIDLARRCCDAPIYSVCPRPPLNRLDDFWRNVQPELLAALKKHGAAPAVFRYKVWRLYADAERQRASECGASLS